MARRKLCLVIVITLVANTLKILGLRWSPYAVRAAVTSSDFHNSLCTGIKFRDFHALRGGDEEIYLVVVNAVGFGIPQSHCFRVGRYLSL